MSGRVFPTPMRCGVPGFLLAAVASLFCATPTISADDSPPKSARPGAATESAHAPQPRIQQLIHDLGSPQYTARRAAANELRQIGAEAFDLLYAATDDTDPEVAASANYLLRQIPIRWLQPDDAPDVRSKMRQYGQETETARLLRVQQLARLSRNVAAGVLCRIARYDRSPLISRSAALAIIRPAEKSKSEPSVE